MKVMVIGGAGFIGSHLVDRLISQGHQAVVVDNLSTGFRENIHPGATFYQVDICKRELSRVFEREKPDIVNHHGGHMSVQVSVQDPRKDAEINVLGSLNVIQACREHRVKKLIYISAGETVYGEPHYLPCDETHPVKPICPHGVAKHITEHYLYVYERLHGLDYTVLRYPNVYGPRQDPSGETGVVAIFAHQMLKEQPIIINGTGGQERDFVHVSDVVEANLLVMEKGAGQVYNIGSGHGTSVNRIFHVLADLTGYTGQPVHGPAIPGEVFKICLDGTKARQEMGWQPRIALRDGLTSVVDYLRSGLTTISLSPPVRSLNKVS